MKSQQNRIELVTRPDPYVIIYFGQELKSNTALGMAAAAMAISSQFPSALTMPHQASQQPPVRTHQDKCTAPPPSSSANNNIQQQPNNNGGIQNGITSSAKPGTVTEFVIFW